MQALPITKLAGLLVKTVAKPVSKRIKHEFSRYEVTRRMLIGIGQASHTITSRLTIWSAGYRVRSITPLDNDKALKEGAELVGEVFIFGVSGGIVVWEYNRSSEKEKAKQAKIREEAQQQRDALQAKLKSLDKRLTAVEDVMKSNSHFPIHFGKQYVEPSDTVPIVEDDTKTGNGPQLPVTADLQAATTTTPTSGRDGSKTSTKSNDNEEEPSPLQKRLTKIEETKSIWERFVWRPW